MTNTSQDTFSRIAAITAKKLGIDQSSITMSSTLQNLGVDSIDLVEIIMKVEEEFTIAIDDEKAGQLKTVGDVVTYVDSLRKS